MSRLAHSASLSLLGALAIALPATLILTAPAPSLTASAQPTSAQPTAAQPASSPATRAPFTPDLSTPVSAFASWYSAFKTDDRQSVLACSDLSDPATRKRMEAVIDVGLKVRQIYRLAEQRFPGPQARDLIQGMGMQMTDPQIDNLAALIKAETAKLDGNTANVAGMMLRKVGADWKVVGSGPETDKMLKVQGPAVNALLQRLAAKQFKTAGEALAFYNAEVSKNHPATMQTQSRPAGR